MAFYKLDVVLEFQVVRAEVPPTRSREATIEGDKSRPSEIRETSDDCRLLGTLQDFLQGLVYFYSSGAVVYESQLPESVHKKIESRTSSADHFRQNLLTYGN